MSEEEIIKVLLNHCQECDLREYSSCNECENKFKKAIKGLLDLYNKEKANNIELKVLIETNLKYSHKLEQDLFENASNYIISKDKIKAKIKELKEQEAKCIFTKNGIIVPALIISTLEELLEE